MLALLMPALFYQMEGANRFVFLLAMTVYVYNGQLYVALKSA